MRVTAFLVTLLVCVFASFGQETAQVQPNSFGKSERPVNVVSSNFGDPTTRQSGDKRRRFEVGVQFTSLMREGDGDRNGFGGRFGYDFATFGKGKYVATAEAEINFLPGNRTISEPSIFGIGSRRDGRVLQGFFGAKVGRKFEKFGIFGKFRPGFVQYSRGKQNISGTSPNLVYTVDSEINAAFDVGGVLEFYPTKRITTRFDAGDTIVRFGQRTAQGFFFGGYLPIAIPRPAETKHNFQFSAGIGFRF